MREKIKIYEFQEDIDNGKLDITFEKIVDKAIELYEKERLEYQKFIQDKNIISVSSAQELLAKMLTEK